MKNKSYASSNKNNIFKNKWRLQFLNEIIPFVLSGILSGLAATIFLYSLNWITDFRDDHSYIIYFLPFAGLGIGYLYYLWGQDVSKGNHLVLEEIHNPNKIIPIRMTPLIFVGTLLTHLFGGSAGREGTAVQMGASLSDQLTHFFKLNMDQRRRVLIAGTGSAFGAAIGTPWAGVLFGMEVIYIGKLHLNALLQSVLSSFIAFAVTKILHAPHSHFEALQIEHYQIQTFFYVVVAAICFGVSARIFLNLTHIMEKFMARIQLFPPLKPMIFGFIILYLYHVEGSMQYAGLGIPVIQNSFHTIVDIKIPFVKMFFTILTVSTGFKGGEFVPLVFMGATLGSALSLFLPVQTTLLAYLGFAAVFGAAANTPLTCTILAIELFGIQIAPYAFIACFVSYFVTGHIGIYKNQKIIKSKPDQVRFIFSLLNPMNKKNK